ncbi:GRAM domain-containing protein 2B-like [Hippocampus zosterae]|uniref:GRAM domain-containing protein 2B-like n=1 Tax=Hippocampus zosterae TaxID=109293 RepID=UPI00223DD9A4|nr:GRAM domain-containing protein 2B-like [Hippocampus zosterae]
MKWRGMQSCSSFSYQKEAISSSSAPGYAPHFPASPPTPPRFLLLLHLANFPTISPVCAKALDPRVISYASSRGWPAAGEEGANDTVVMGEPAERPLTPPCRTTECRRGRSYKADNEGPLGRRRPSHLRLRQPEGKKSPSAQLSKTNVQFHKLFKEVSRDEALAQSYTCALQRDILYQGKMFVSPNWICFHSKVFGRDTKIAIRTASVTFIKKTKTALLVPNALVIESTREQHVFVSFLSRNTTYKFLRSVCIHLELEKTRSSHAAPAREDGFGVELLPSLPLWAHCINIPVRPRQDFSRAFSELDGVVRQRRREMEAESSSSSGSRTPECDKMDEFAGLPDSFPSREVSVHADVHLPPGQKSPGNNAQHLTTDKAGPQASSLSVLLIYLLLVGVLLMSSCYMAFKMAALERRLDAMMSARDRLHGGNAVTLQDAAIVGELSASMIKLEKIQGNLQKLLDET